MEDLFIVKELSKKLKKNLHEIPDDAGAVRAGRDTLRVVALDLDACDGGLVFLELEQEVGGVCVTLGYHLTRYPPHAHVTVPPTTHYVLAVCVRGQGCHTQFVRIVNLVHWLA